MGNELWSYILTIVGVTGFLFVGRKVWWAWYINLACQALWVAYALITEQYGFIFAAAVYTVAFGKNAWEWTRERFAPSPSKAYSDVQEGLLKAQTSGIISVNEIRKATHSNVLFGGGTVNDIRRAMGFNKPAPGETDTFEWKDIHPTHRMYANNAPIEEYNFCVNCYAETKTQQGVLRARCFPLEEKLEFLKTNGG